MAVPQRGPWFGGCCGLPGTKMELLLCTWGVCLVLVVCYGVCSAPCARWDGASGHRVQVHRKGACLEAGFGEGRSWPS